MWILIRADAREVHQFSPRIQRRLTPWRRFSKCILMIHDIAPWAMHSKLRLAETPPRRAGCWSSSVAYRHGCFNSHTLPRTAELCIRAERRPARKMTERARFGRAKRTTFISRVSTARSGFPALIQLMLIVMMMHANNGAAREPRALPSPPRRKRGDVRR